MIDPMNLLSLNSGEFPTLHWVMVHWNGFIKLGKMIKIAKSSLFSVVLRVQTHIIKIQ